MKKIIIILLCIISLSAGCTTDKNHTKNSGNPNDNLLTINIDNSNVVIDKDFEITATLSHTINNKEPLAVQFSSSDDSIIYLKDSSCKILSGKFSCTILGQATKLGAASITANIPQLNTAATTSINVVGHNTMTVFIDGNKDNNIALGQRIPITVVANDPTFIKHSINITIISSNSDVLLVDHDSSCEITTLKPKCLIWVTSTKIGNVEITASTASQELMEAKSQVIKVSDQFSYKTSLDPNNIPEVANQIIDHEDIGDDTEQENPVAIGYGLDDRFGILPAGVTGFHNCLSKELDLSYGTPKNIPYYSEVLPINDIFVNYQENLLTNLSKSSTAQYQKKHLYQDNVINKYYGQVFTIPVTLNNIIAERISDQALALLQKSTDEFLKYCGESVLITGKIGAALVINTSLVFENIDTQNNFDEKYHYKYNDAINISQIMNNINDFKNTTGKTVQLVIHVNQFGGTHKELDDVLKKYNITDNSITCLSGHTSRCLSLITDVTEYGNNYFENNVKDLATLQYFILGKRFDYGIFPGVKIEIPELTAEYQKSVQNLTDSIHLDHNSYNFLRRYQQQSFISLLEDNMKTKLATLIKNYKNMINDYSVHANVLNGCIKDIANLNVSCVNAANSVESTRETYQSDINAVQVLSKFIYVEYHGIGNDEALIPITDYSTCEITNSKNISNDNPKKQWAPVCYGKFAVYHYKTHSFSNNAICFVDTSADKHFFAEIGHQDWINANKAVYCQLNAGTVHHVYIDNEGAMGHSMRDNPSTEIKDNVDAIFEFSKFNDSIII